MKINNKIICDNSWTLFLDRDGTINERIMNGYVTKIEEFIFLKGAIKAIDEFSKLFKRIIIVTNQQGIGKGLFSESDLAKVHDHMQSQFIGNKNPIDAIFHCPELKENNPICRKPAPGMAMQAKAKFPEIEFTKSIMVGDTESDIAFGKNLLMKTVLISHSETQEDFGADIVVDSLAELATYLG